MHDASARHAFADALDECTSKLDRDSDSFMIEAEAAVVEASKHAGASTKQQRDSELSRPSAREQLLQVQVTQNHNLEALKELRQLRRKRFIRQRIDKLQRLSSAEQQLGSSMRD